jgi:hypothetical protein
LPPKAAATFFMLASRSDGSTMQAGLPSTCTTRVFSTRCGGSPSDSAACRPTLAASAS